MNLLLYLAVPLISYLGGFFAYVLTLKFVWDQTLGGETAAVLFWGAATYFPLAVPLYFLMIRWVDSRYAAKKWLLYPLVCMLVFFVPTALVMLNFGELRLFTPEAMLFHSFFLSAGLIFGLGVYEVKRWMGGRYPKDER